MGINEFLRLVVERLEGLNLRYFVTGSVASIAYGESRFTNDIDIVVELPPDRIPDFLRAFPEKDFYCSEAAVRLAVRERFSFNLLHPESGLKVDFILPKREAYASSEMRRAVRIRTESTWDAMYISPEDLILNKLIFFRDGGSDKHPRDILGVLRVQGDRIDREYIEEWCCRLGLTELWADVVTRESAP